MLSFFSQLSGDVPENLREQVIRAIGFKLQQQVMRLRT